MIEPPYFEDSLDRNYYLKWVQPLEGYFTAKDCLDDESFIIAMEKPQDVAYY